MSLNKTSYERQDFISYTEDFSARCYLMRRFPEGGTLYRNYFTLKKNIDLKELNDLADFSILETDTINNPPYKLLLSDLEEKIVLEFSESCTRLYLYSYEKSELFEKIIKWAVANKPIPERNQISIILQNNQGFYLSEFPARQVDVNMEHYNVNYSLHEIRDLVSDEKPGLVLLDGPPGTGKSFFIRHLCNEIDKTFVIVPNHIMGNLNDPKFLTFAISDLVNCVLILEDGEILLGDRKKYNNSAASVLLNITDGLMGDLLNLKILASINNNEHIDPALLRKGRLLAKVDFAKIKDPAQMALIFKNLGLDTGKVEAEFFTEPRALTEFYNYNSDNGVEVSEPKIGFGR